jgi:hypothetical protein
MLTFTEFPEASEAFPPDTSKSGSRYENSRFLNLSESEAPSIEQQERLPTTRTDTKCSKVSKIKRIDF